MQVASRRFLEVVGALALVGVLGLGATAYVALRTSRGLRLDGEAMDAVTSPQLALSRLHEGLGWVSVGSVGLSLLACVALALGRRRLDLALGVAVLIAGANVTTQLLKGPAVHSPRPEHGAQQPAERAHDGRTLDRAGRGHRRTAALAPIRRDGGFCHCHPRRGGDGPGAVAPTL